MAVPKGKVSKSRGRKRRTHWKLNLPSISACPHCHQMKLTHRVCPSCGMYNGVQVIQMDEKK
ncbi:MAG: 50S ribosomal protein L32 [Christensenellales bacterium]|jgi:large subunit ribosomal protein L32|nr:50S ribosomal protein L32 [Clostridiales bacterium]